MQARKGFGYDGQIEVQYEITCVSNVPRIGEPFLPKGVRGDFCYY